VHGVKVQKLKRQAFFTACLSWRKKKKSGVGLGLAETLHTIALFPLAAFLEQFDALKAFQNVAFLYDTTETLKAFMLGHEGNC
jgi:hypothetical protein